MVEVWLGACSLWGGSGVHGCLAAAGVAADDDTQSWSGVVEGSPSQEGFHAGPGHRLIGVSIRPPSWGPPRGQAAGQLSSRSIMTAVAVLERAPTTAALGANAGLTTEPLSAPFFSLGHHACTCL